MANYNTSANVILSINGKQAQKMLSTLEKDAQRLEKQIAKAATAGDKATMKKLQRELNTTKRTIDQLKNSSQNVDNVLRRLDKATPKELQRTLKTLQQQMNGIQRGSAAWDAHIAKIRMVKAEIQKVNATMATQKSLWTRMNNWLNSCQTAILGVAAAITGLVMAGRKAVNAFAEMDEQLANTRKYTGMTEDNVKKLNEAFRQMDTRTPRDKLNELAQEAGRLGKNTLESVQGYVEAADIINVALVDLGEGATQTIAKLTNIFGVEELLGTKDAMLAVGSTVNVLSQNCTASKPYLVEFAQRMAGIGSQAGLTIPQILAFGAVLDANGQKVEMSATAIQKVIMNLANKNHEFAQTLGLDAQLLNETLKHSAKDGLLMFLEALQKMGQDVGFENATMTLAPAFKEMGLDAARVSQVLSTLAMHLDEVKWQMGEADKAFNEATSATKEYEIFNNTAQAAIDKAKKRVSELAIELGEKLYPVMKHIYTSSGIFLRVLNQLVTFFIQYKTEILTVVGAIAAYNAIILVYNTRTLLASKYTAMMNGALNLASKAIPALRLLITPLINTVQYFTNGLQVNYDMQQRWRKSLEAMKFTNWIGLFVALAGAVYLFTKRLMESKSEAEKTREMYAQIENEANQACAVQIKMLDELYKKTQDQTLAQEKRIQAIERLRQIYPDYFKDIANEAFLAGKAADAYVALKNAILDAARAKGRENAIAKLEEEIQTTQDEYDEERRDWVKIQLNQRFKNSNNPNYNPDNDPDYRLAQWNLDVLEKRYQPKIDRLKARQDNLAQQNAEYELNKPKQSSIASEYSNLYTGGGGHRSSGSKGSSDSNSNSSASIDKFAAEDAWREREEAKSRIQYATGEIDFLAHTRRMNDILVEYHKRKLDHTDLTENERLKITAEWSEAMKKRLDDDAAATIDAEEKAYNSRIAELKQFYIDGKISKETFDLKVEEEEIRHQQKLVELTEEGSKERLQAEQQLQALLISQMERRQKEREKLEAQYAEFKKDYFGDNPQEAQAKYDADLALLDVVYQRELQAAGENAQEKLRIDEAYEKAKLALKKKYNLLAEEDTRNAMKKGIDASLEWLQSDGGKALTGTMETLVSGMSSIFSQLSSVIQAELEIQTAKIEKRYDAEIDRAEGNSYQVKKLEKQKETEIAKAKNEANRKMFAMQVIQAVAQTAQNALSAYGSAAAIPVVGYILAPIAAAMAVAAGAIQIAAIKKQQQASEAQGYMSGGFTPEGKADEVAGVVHKGEWVASQRLTKNPQTRPLLEALDYAQRTNTIGSITMADVSKTITAPAVLAAQPSAPTVVNNTYNQQTAPSDDGRMVAVLDRLDERLNEPFVTINTVAGDYGIQKAQDDYNKLMKNKSPKSKR